MTIAPQPPANTGIPRGIRARVAASSWGERFGAVAAAASLITSLALIFVQPPINDETDYSAPPVTWVRDGHWGSPVFEPKGDPRIGNETLTYYVLPGHPLTVVPSVALFGVSLPAMRMKSWLFSALALFILFRVFVRLSVPRPYAGVAVGMIALDRTWVVAASLVRPELQVFVFALGGTYLYVRAVQERRPVLALLGGASVAFGVFSHGNAIAFGLVCVLFALGALRRDWRNGSVYAGAAGVALVVAAYAAFVSIRPDLYKAQMGWTASTWDRLDTWTHPVASLGRELSRWLNLYASNVQSAPRQLVYAIATGLSLGAMALVALRRKHGPRAAATALLAMLATTVFVFSFLNNIKSSFYFLYRTWLATGCLAIAACYLPLSERPWLKASWIAALALIVGIHAAKDVAYVRSALSEGRAWDEMAAVARAAAGPTDKVTGVEETAFVFGLSPQFRVDDYYGFYSGRRPDLVFLQKLGAPAMTITRSAIGGACVGDQKGADVFTRFYGPMAKQQIDRDRDALCAYFSALDASSTVVHQNRDYVMLRIDPPPQLR